MHLANGLKWPRWCWFVTTGILLAALVVHPLRVTLASPVKIASVIDDLFDDAYYYLGVAANLAESGRSTLDGITLTNGYHPMWLLTLAALAKAIGTSTWRFFVATHWLIAVIAAMGPLMALLWRRSSSAETALIAGAAISITLLQYPVVFLQGMEPILMVPLFVPLVVLLVWCPRNNW
jgi:hypothetical protein